MLIQSTCVPRETSLLIKRKHSRTATPGILIPLTPTVDRPSITRTGNGDSVDQVGAALRRRWWPLVVYGIMGVWSTARWQIRQNPSSTRGKPKKRNMVPGLGFTTNGSKKPTRRRHAALMNVSATIGLAAI
ncbi:uncharacterized protein PG986_001699 [Apiospora aurea]|uniref:Uncharacterized protein n=1 Tax=Apiospora aurea TaxID=335848 RepID=A0ABR1QXJ8_9PEZI